MMLYFDIITFKSIDIEGIIFENLKFKKIY